MANQLRRYNVSNLGTLIESFDNIGDWTGSGTGSVASETSDYQEGRGAIKVISLDSSNNQQAIKTINNSFLNTGSFWFWVKPDSKTSAIAIGFTSQTSFSTQSLSATISSTSLLPNKWNLVRVQKSDFTSAGGEDWSTTKIRMRIRNVSTDGNSSIAIFDELRTDMYCRPKVIIQCDNAGSQSSMMTYMYPIMSNLKLKGTLFVESDIVGTNNSMTLANLQTIYNAGWDLGNHTKTHPDLTSLTESQMDNEISTCNTYLVTNGFTRNNCHKHLSYPLAAYNDTVISIAQNYCLTGRRSTTSGVFVNSYADYFKLPCYSVSSTDSLVTVEAMIDEAITKGQTIILMWESIVLSNPSSGQWTSADFQSLMYYIKSKEQSLDIVTMSEWYNGLTNPRKLA